MASLEYYLKGLRENFAQANKKLAHDQSASLLKAIGEDKEALNEIFALNLTRQGFFSERHTNPVLRFDIAEEANYSLMFHGWIPRKDVEITHQSIHHHGKLYLTSYSAFGPGYRSILFKPGFTTHSETLETLMEVDKYYRNPKGHLEFVGDFTPHVVFLPKEFTVTLALWSLNAPTKAEGLKNHPIVQRNKKLIRLIIDKLGLRKSVGLNTEEDFDFYPDNGGLKLLKVRKTYPDGNLATRAQNVFFVLQQYRFEDSNALAQMQKKLSAEEKVFVEPVLKRFIAGESIEGLIDPEHTTVPKVTIPLTQIEETFPELRQLKLDLD